MGEEQRVTPDAEFAAAVNDSTTSLAVERLQGGGPAPVLVTFGGISGGLFGPPFEFLRQSDGLQVHRVFLRDLEQCWYQRGVPGLGDDVVEVAESLDALIEDLGATRRVFVGTSSGGFAAILFGVLLGVDSVLAFSPQASLTVAARLHAGDRRWRPQVRTARRASKSPLHRDLPTLLTKTSMRGTIKVHFRTDDLIDAAYAKSLERFACVEVTPHPGDHSFVRELRDSNQLRSILTDSLNA